MSINFQQFGHGDPIIIMHGLFGTLDNLKQIARALSNNYSVYLVDLPGHGQSASTSPLNLTEMAKAVLAFADAQGLPSFSILGHSLGGKVAMEMALIAPDKVSKLLVADIAPVQYPRRHDTIIKGLQSIDLVNTQNRQEADKTLAAHVNEIGVRAFLLKSLRKSDEENVSWQWQFDLPTLVANYDNLIASNRAGNYSGPTLFIVGGSSEYVKPEYKTEIENRFSNVKAKVIQNTGHWLHAEKPTAFEKICTDFLSNS